ncbi:uncharacterized protein LOC144139458 [Haemaphysalis longicornis]
MKLVCAMFVVLAAMLLCTTPPGSEAKLGLMFAPFIWAGNLAKDAAQSLVAYKLSLATKALAMITGNRSFRATLAYDSQLDRYEQPAAPAREGHDWTGLERAVAVTAAPNPVEIDNDVKVEWLPGVTKPAIRLPTLPPFPKVVVPSVVVPKVVVPQIIMPKIVVPDLIHSKMAFLNSLSKPGSILTGPKYATGFIKGGIRVGHGKDSGVSFESSGDLGGAAPVQNATTVPAAHPRPQRSLDSGVMGRYFQFIRSNDEGHCIALMVCAMSASPREYGLYGRKVVQFFDGLRPTSSSPVAPYKEASRVGRSGGSCRSHYASCQVNPKYLAQLGSSQLSQVL